jgi:hypothetical protein
LFELTSAAAALLGTFTGGRALPLLHRARGSSLRLPAVVAPSFARGRMVRVRQALIVCTHLGCRCPCPPWTLPAEALPLPSFSCASGVVRTRLSLSRLCSRVGGGVVLRSSTTAGVVRACLSSPCLCSCVGGGVLLRVRSCSLSPVVVAPLFARGRGSTTTCFGSRRIHRTSHLRRGCRTNTTSSTELFAPHAFDTRSRSP